MMNAELTIFSLLLHLFLHTQIGTAEWFAETYDIQGLQHFALLLFWLHTETFRRAVAMCSRVAKRRKRRLEFVRNRAEICASISEEKLLDTNLLSLFEEEVKRETALTDDNSSVILRPCIDLACGAEQQRTP